MRWSDAILHKKRRGRWKYSWLVEPEWSGKRYWDWQKHLLRSGLLKSNSQRTGFNQPRGCKKHFLTKIRLTWLFIMAAKKSGIKANSENQATFLSENILINTHVIHESLTSGIKNLIYFGSSCMYPRDYKPLLQNKIFWQRRLSPVTKVMLLPKYQDSVYVLIFPISIMSHINDHSL